jgi:hypothetical protein
MIKESPYLSQSRMAQTLSLHHDIAKRLITEEVNLRRVNFKRVLTPLPPLENWKRLRFPANFSGNPTNFKSVISLISSRGLKLESTLKIQDPQCEYVLT